jgi:hypothetical protein
MTGETLSGPALRRAVEEALGVECAVDGDGSVYRNAPEGRILVLPDDAAYEVEYEARVPAAALPRVLRSLRAALAGECPTCGGTREVPDPPGGTSQRLTPRGFVRTCPDCRGAALPPEPKIGGTDARTP